jgi:hypothetical protein
MVRQDLIQQILKRDGGIFRKGGSQLEDHQVIPDVLVSVENGFHGLNPVRICGSNDYSNTQALLRFVWY